MKEVRQKTLALALGGGAALGFAHIGFLQVLEENHIHVHAIAGTSMGSLVGAFYAYGYSGKELETIATEKVLLRQFFTDVNPLAFFGTGVVTGKRIQTVLNEYLGKKNIEDLKIPYIAVAVDIITGKKILLKEGNASQAVRASISIPGVFTPIKKDEMLLIDGGVIDNVPGDVALEFHTDVIVAVDVLGDFPVQKQVKNIPTILLRSFGLLQREYEKCKPNVANLKITMTLEGVSEASFQKTTIQKAIRMGRKYAKEHLEEIKKLVLMK